MSVVKVDLEIFCHSVQKNLKSMREIKNVIMMALSKAEVDKSTYARCGIIVDVTPLEPEWGAYNIGIF